MASQHEGHLLFKSIEAMNRCRNIKKGQTVCATNNKTQKNQCFVYLGRKKNKSQFQRLSSNSPLKKVRRITKSLTNSNDSPKYNMNNIHNVKCGKTAGSNRCHFTRPNESSHRDCMISNKKPFMCVNKPKYDKTQCGFSKKGRKCAFLQRNGLINLNCKISSKTKRCIKI